MKKSGNQKSDASLRGIQEKTYQRMILGRAGLLPHELRPSGTLFAKQESFSIPEGFLPSPANSPGFFAPSTLPPSRYFPLNPRYLDEAPIFPGNAPAYKANQNSNDWIVLDSQSHCDDTFDDALGVPDETSKPNAQHDISQFRQLQSDYEKLEFELEASRNFIQELMTREAIHTQMIELFCGVNPSLPDEESYFYEEEINPIFISKWDTLPDGTVSYNPLSNPHMRRILNDIGKMLLPRVLRDKIKKSVLVQMKKKKHVQKEIIEYGKKALIGQCTVKFFDKEVVHHQKRRAKTPVGCRQRKKEERHDVPSRRVFLRQSSLSQGQKELNKFLGIWRIEDPPMDEAVPLHTLLSEPYDSKLEESPMDEMEALSLD